MTAEAALLELAGVSKRFGRITVADSLSLRFTAGETVGIVGPNGAGKSTLFAMIAGDLKPARGLATRPRVLLLDEVAGGLTDPEVAQLVDIVEQVRQRSVAVVWVEHVVHALTRAVGRIICLAGGRLIAEGDPESVLANPEVKEVYLGVDIDA